MVRKVAAAWASFFLPGFHPWNHDDRALIEQEEKARSARVAAA